MIILDERALYTRDALEVTCVKALEEEAALVAEDGSRISTSGSAVA